MDDHDVSPRHAEQPERLMTMAETQETLQVSRPGVYRLVRAGELPVIRIGTRVRFAPSDVAALIARGRSPQAPLESMTASK
jgi:excisionase family DNA binding protein